MSILAQDFPFNSINKSMYVKLINRSELVNNRLFLQDISPGDIVVIDNHNKVINIPQYEVYKNGLFSGVELDFTNYDQLNGWKIRFFNINNISSVINMEDTALETLIKLSLIFN